MISALTRRSISRELLGAHRLAPREVEAQPVRLHQRAGLLGGVAEHLVQSAACSRWVAVWLRWVSTRGPCSTRAVTSAPLTQPALARPRRGGRSAPRSASGCRAPAPDRPPTSARPGRRPGRRTRRRTASRRAPPRPARPRRADPRGRPVPISATTVAVDLEPLVADELGRHAGARPGPRARAGSGPAGRPSTTPDRAAAPPRGRRAKPSWSSARPSSWANSSSSSDRDAVGLVEVEDHARPGRRPRLPA